MLKIVCEIRFAPEEFEVYRTPEHATDMLRAAIQRAFVLLHGDEFSVQVSDVDTVNWLPREPA